MNCPNCQQLISEGSKYCPNCGTLLQQTPIPQSQPPQKTKMDTATKALIFSGIGFFVPCIGWLLCIVGLILGIAALNNIKKKIEPDSGKVLAIIAIILSIIQFLMTIFALFWLMGAGFLFLHQMFRLGY